MNTAVHECGQVRHLAGRDHGVDQIPLGSVQANEQQLPRAPRGTVVPAAGARGAQKKGQGQDRVRKTTR